MITRIVRLAIRAAATQMLVDYAWGRGRDWPLATLRAAGHSVAYPDVVAREACKRERRGQDRDPMRRW